MRHWAGVFGVFWLGCGSVLTPSDSNQSGDFAVTVSPMPLRIVQGTAEPATVTLTRTGYTGAVALSVTGLPGGVTVDPMTIGAGTDGGTLVFRSTSAAVLGGSATGTVIGDGGGVTRNTMLQVYVQGPHGALDTTFNTTGKVIAPLGGTTGGDGAQGVVIMPNGNIVVVGGGTNNSQNFAGAIALTAAGQLDNGMFTGGKLIGGFTAGTSTSDHFLSVGVQGDGKLVASGYAGVLGLSHYFLLARFTSAGILDTTFGTGNSGYVITNFGAEGDGGDAKSLAMTIKPDQSIVLGGFYTGSTFATARYSTSGTLIGKLAPPPISGAVTCLAAGANGGLLIVGPAAAAVGLLRYTSGDTLDASFGGGTGATTGVLKNMGSDFPASVNMLGDDSFYLGALTNNGTNYDAALAHFSAAGALDTTFNGVGYVTTPTNLTTASEKAVATILQANGQVILAYTIDSGGMTHKNFAWVRVGTDGKIDSTTNVVITDFGTGDDVVGGVALQPDGRIVIVGTVAANGRNNFGVARYWP